MRDRISVVSSIAASKACKASGRSWLAVAWTPRRFHCRASSNLCMSWSLRAGGEEDNEGKEAGKGTWWIEDNLGMRV